MLAKRIIPCLDVKNGQVVKGINFEGLREVGDPVEMGAFYSEQGADELVYLDISASSEGRKTFTGLVSRIAERIDIPFTVGGGISSFEDAARLLEAGADKITINTAAVFHPEIISKIASRYGSQFVVVAIDARTVASGTVAEPVEATSLYGSAYWQVMTHGGKRPTDKELYSWAKEVRNLGAGEILFTSMDHDGTRNGYAVEAYSRLADELSIPSDRLRWGGKRRRHRGSPDEGPGRRRPRREHIPLRRNLHSRFEKNPPLTRSECKNIKGTL